MGRDLGVPLGASPSLAPGSLPWERLPPWRNPPRGQTPCTTSRRRGRGCRAQKSCKSQARATSVTPAARGHGTERVLGAVGTPVRRTRIKLVSLLAETDLFPHQEQGAGALPVRPRRRGGHESRARGGLQPERAEQLGLVLRGRAAQKPGQGSLHDSRAAEPEGTRVPHPKVIF